LKKKIKKDKWEGEGVEEEKLRGGGKEKERRGKLQ
jgi:hypothetical protein